jgi:hypothetical protein
MAGAVSLRVALLVAGSFLLLGARSDGSGPGRADIPEAEAVCFHPVSFDPAGYWASPVGGGEVTQADLDTLQLLPPYGDVPSSRAEISRRLSDPDLDEPQALLARELLVFILNVRHRLVSAGLLLEMPDTTLVPAGVVIDVSIGAWAEGTEIQRLALASILASVNGADGVRVAGGCPATAALSGR